jgi:hypothetical protein
VNPGRYNITVVSGTTFQLSPQWLINNLPVDLNGYSEDMQVSDVSNNHITEISTGNGRAVITPATGTVTLTLTASQTAALTVGNYNYGLNLTSSGGIVYQILQGAFILSASQVQ